MGITIATIAGGKLIYDWLFTTSMWKESSCILYVCHDMPQHVPIL